MGLLRDLAEEGIVMSAYGTFRAGEIIAKVSAIPAKISWALLFAQTVIPAMNNTFLHNHFLSSIPFGNIPAGVDIAAGSIAALHTTAHLTANTIEKAASRRRY